MAIAAPARVDPAWIDANGHMNMAHYVAIFDTVGETLLEAYGLGAPYTAAANCGLFTLEATIRYQREVVAGDPLRITLHLRRTDGKRLWTFLEMHHAEQGYLAATMDQLAIHVDLATRKVTPFPQALQQSLAQAVDPAD